MSVLRCFLEVGSGNLLTLEAYNGSWDKSNFGCDDFRMMKMR